MDFARKILENYGWKEGDGLGKNNTGIAKPLKASLKFDNAGFGADQAADDFNNHWWERVFNEAAENVEICREGEKVKMSLKDEGSSVEISTKGYSMKKLTKVKKINGETSAKNSYENFLRSATLNNLGGEIENADKMDAHDIEVSKVNVLTDEELFKACGGRTAHKGARHGLKLSGKLSRIEQQEAEFLAKMMAKHKRLNKNDLSIISAADCTQQNEVEISAKKSKLKKKKRKHSEKSPNKVKTNSELTFVENKKEKLFNKETGIAQICDNIIPDMSKDNQEEKHIFKKAKKIKISLEEKSLSKKKNKK